MQIFNLNLIEFADESLSKKNPIQLSNLEYVTVRISQFWGVYLVVLLLLEITEEKLEHPQVPLTSKNALFEVCNMNI